MKTITLNKAVKVKLPRMPNFLLAERGDEKFHVGDLSESEAKYFAEAMREEFINHAFRARKR